jgi:hypothetical protein
MQKENSIVSLARDANRLQLDSLSWEKLIDGAFCDYWIDAEPRQQVRLLMGVGHIQHVLHLVQRAERNIAIHANVGILPRRFMNRTKRKAEATRDDKFLEYWDESSSRSRATAQKLSKQE